MPQRDLILLAFFVVSVPICFVRPFYGVCLWAVVSFLNPQAYIWGGAAFFPWAMAVAIPTIAGMLIFSRSFSNLTSFKVFLLGFLWLWFTVTTLASTSTALFLHHAPETWAQWQFVTKMLLMTLVTIAVVNSFARLRILIMVMAGSLRLLRSESVPFSWSLRESAYRLYGPSKSMIADNNDFGLALNMALPLFFLLAQTEAKRWVRLLCGFLFVITIPAIFFTYSRGDLIGLVAVGILMLIRLKQRLLILPVILLGIALGIMFAPQSWRDRMNPGQGLDNSARERLNSWTFSWNLASDYPITGGGFATFTPELFDRYAPAGNDVHGPHSVYFQILGEHGFVGLLLYLTVIASCFISVFRLLRKARAYEDPLVASYANMIRLSIVGFLVSGIFLGRAYFDYYFAVVACLIILEKVAEKRFAPRRLKHPTKRVTKRMVRNFSSGTMKWFHGKCDASNRDCDEYVPLRVRYRS